MATSIPTNLTDRELVQIVGPDGLVTSFQYDKETNSLIKKESQIILPAFHGFTHITTDPIPVATPWLQGLMGADDKAKLDSISQTRLGVLGFMGAGFPDDGGWMQGDIILSAGSEFIHLERVGNIVRFTVDTPVPLSCGCEECSQIYFIQDESDTNAVRPPSCNGIMPGINGYGELKIYLYPQNSLFNPNDSANFFSAKNQYPSIYFKRYNNGNSSMSAAEAGIILRRNSDTTINVGWAMTPGPSNVVECIWYVGSDNTGKQMSFKFLPQVQNGLLGALMFNGHSITRQMAIITSLTNNVTQTNQYNVKMWSILNNLPVGNEFVATNIWAFSGTSYVNDSTVQLLQVGQLVELWQFEVSNVNGVSTYSYYFRQQPTASEANMWSDAAHIEFGNIVYKKDNENSVTTTDPIAVIDGNSDNRLVERSEWGITAFEYVVSPTDGIYNGIKYEPSGNILNGKYLATIDYSKPGLIVSTAPLDNRGDFNGDGSIDNTDLTALMTAMNSNLGDSNYNVIYDMNHDNAINVRDLEIFGTNFNIRNRNVIDRPVMLWNRKNYSNVMIKMNIGRPTTGAFPLDIVFGAPVDSFDSKHMVVVSRGVFRNAPYQNMPYIMVSGIDYKDLPSAGTVRILNGVYRDAIWKFNSKILTGSSIILIGNNEMFPFDEDFLVASDVTFTSLSPTSINTVICQLLHNDYTANALRLQFFINIGSTETVQLQMRVGTLDMGTVYEYDSRQVEQDDFICGLKPGQFAISDSMTQMGFISDGIGNSIVSDPTDFKVYDGGTLPAPVNGQVEQWNELIMMVRDAELWVWWNNKLISPSSQASANLPTPVAVNSKYWPIVPAVGKIGLRMFPTASVRNVTISNQLSHFNEYSV